MIITKVSPDRWQQAQTWECEIQKQIAAKGDDWNVWWYDKFNNYDVIFGKYFYDVLEVGCGPNTNVRILPVNWSFLWLEDPLLKSYIESDAKVSKLACNRIYEPIEEMDLFIPMDLIICINVLDHVQDAEKCMAQMQRVLAPHGVLIIGQDLSNAEDYERCPDSWEDVGHPIKLDEAFFMERLTNYKPLFHKVLAREEGRNPRCHYGTLLWIGEK